MADPVSDAVEVIEHFYREGLTDGLPVVPPTQDAVERFLEAAGVGAEEVLGTRASRNWRVTAQKVAINAVMAGCLPEYAPVVVSAMQALFEPEFNASALAETAGASAAMIVVNGPTRNAIDLNCGWNLLGPGRRANATIGRSLRLVLMNVCREIPGVTDKSTFGHSGRYTMCFGENEEASPWSPFHVEKGFSLESSTVEPNSGRASDGSVQPKGPGPREHTANYCSYHCIFGALQRWSDNSNESRACGNHIGGRLVEAGSEGIPGNQVE